MTSRNAFNVLGVHKRYRRNRAVLADVSFGVALGSVVGLFGPNGCGKSTLLNLVVGVDRPDEGKVCFCRTWPDTPHRRIPLATVFQDYRASLLPWMKVRDNLLLPAKLARQPLDEAERTLAALVAHFEIDIPLDRHPYQLSGGQQQTIALLRALVAHPRVLVLDEPFAALDHHVTLRIRDRLLSWVAEREITVVVSSHSADDLVYMCDRVLVLHGPPLTIADDVPVDATRPRTPDLLVAPSFLALRTRVLGLPVPTRLALEEASR